MLHEDEGVDTFGFDSTFLNSLHTEGWLEQAANKIAFIVCLFQTQLSLSGKLYNAFSELIQVNCFPCHYISERVNFIYVWSWSWW